MFFPNDFTKISLPNRNIYNSKMCNYIYVLCVQTHFFVCLYTKNLYLNYFNSVYRDNMKIANSYDMTVFSVVSYCEVKCYICV